MDDDPVRRAARKLTSRQRQQWARIADEQAQFCRETATMADVYEAVAAVMRSAEANEQALLDGYAGDFREAEEAGKHAHTLLVVSGREPAETLD